jgi:adenylate cyclase
MRLSRLWPQERVERQLGDGAGWGLLIGLLGVMALALPAALSQDLELSWMFGHRGPRAAPPEVVVIALDEHSARTLGLPAAPRTWPRNLHAELVRYLSREGAAVISFDLTFETPAADARHDEDFAAAIRAAGNVLLTESIQRETIGLPEVDGRSGGDAVIATTRPPIPLLAQAALGHAPFVLPKDTRVSSYWTHLGEGADTPTLPVLAFQAYAARAPGGTRLGDAAAAPPSSQGSQYLDFYGPSHSIATVRYSDALAAARSLGRPLDVRDKAVFVGYSAATQGGQDRLRDDYRTVYSREDGLDISGVEIAATAFANLLEDRPLRPIGPAPQLAIVLGWGLVLGLLCRRLRPLHAVGAVLVLCALYIAWVMRLFDTRALWLPSIVPVGIQAPLMLFIGVWLSYRDSSRERETIKRAFAYFVPAAVVEQLARRVGPVTRDNHVVFGVCLATDVENYTALAEQTAPVRLGELMNEYYAELFVPVERTHGVIVDIVGDAMVAIWVRASSDLEPRKAACQAALEIVERVDRFNHAGTGRPPLPTRLGLHSGDMLVGSIGASGHFEYRAVGDIVNTASRIQGLNKVLGTRLLASAATVAGLQGHATRPLGSFLLAGKSNAIAVVELCAARTDESVSRHVASFAGALAAYEAGRWEVALQGFAEVLRREPADGPAPFYCERCRHLVENPPAGEWSPVIRIEEK